MDSPLIERFRYLFVEISPNDSCRRGKRYRDTSVKARVYVVRFCPIKRFHKGTHGLVSLGVGATLLPVELRPLPARARWGYEAGSPVIKGGVAHLNKDL